MVLRKRSGAEFSSNMDLSSVVVAPRPPFKTSINRAFRSTSRRAMVMASILVEAPVMATTRSKRASSRLMVSLKGENREIGRRCQMGMYETGIKSVYKEYSGWALCSISK